MVGQVPNKEASTVVDAFYEKVILEHTAPYMVLSDNGKEFANDTMAQLCDALNIKHNFTSPYMPQSNGKTENLINSSKPQSENYVKMINKVGFKYKADPYGI